MKNEELAISSARALFAQDPTASWVYARALADFDRHEQLVEFLLRPDPRQPYAITWVIFRPSYSALHRDPRFMMIADRLGALDYWRATGKWPDFCARADLHYSCQNEASKLQ